MSRDVTLVVPVYNALQDTIECLSSLLSSDAGECRIIVNDDGSPLEVIENLQKSFGGRGNVEIHSNFRNRGYTANVQYGVDAATTDFVGVVNSDTKFPKLWLGKLLAQLNANPAHVAFGPLSNAASYQSIPDLVNDLGEFSSNPEFGMFAEQREHINAFLEMCFGGKAVDVPILNGFCTLFRRETLMRAGAFNPQAFPTGYGEENDLCMRLLASGHRLGVAIDTFVYHSKSKSFGADKKREYSRAGRETLEKIYGVGFVPDYAAVLERNSALAALRFTMAYGFRTPRPPLVITPETGETLMVGLVGESSPAVLLNGPLSATVWPDIVETHAPVAGQGFSLEVGMAYVKVNVPEGMTLSFAAENPVASLLGVCAVLSHYRDLAVDILPGIARSETVVKALGALDFRYAYLDSSAARSNAA